MKTASVMLLIATAATLVLAGACTDSSGGDAKEGDRITIARITVGELNERIEGGEQITIVDVRSLSSFEVSHIANAVSIPSNEILDRLHELPMGQAIVLYCT